MKGGAHLTSEDLNPDPMIKRLTDEIFCQWHSLISKYDQNRPSCGEPTSLREVIYELH